MKNRFLRSQRQRYLLYKKFEGKCAICGKDLPDIWHADHVVPYSLDPTTNFYGMQATCPTCNLRKGNKMPSNTAIGTNLIQRTYRFDLLRSGQRDGINTVLDRLMSGLKTTAGILPTRYGKSDLIRLAILDAKNSGLACGGLVITPNSILRDQMVQKKKLEACFKRVFYQGPDVWADVHRKVPLKGLHQSGELYAAITIQLLLGAKGANLEQYCDLISDQVKRNGGAPVLVFIDECQYESENNSWGSCVEPLIAAGAHVVLLTATAVRADNQTIPGFKCKVEEKGQTQKVVVKASEVDENILIYQKFNALNRVVLLEGDFETTFKEAWGDGYLCKVTHKTIDADLTHVFPGQDMEGKSKLSELSSKMVRDVLKDVVRNPTFIQESVTALLEELGDFRAIDSFTKGLVYTVSDDSSVEVANAHAKDVKDEIKRQAPHMRVEIATTSEDLEGESRNHILGFEESNIDILIVKQMGGVGLDVGPLKVILDLSNHRQVASFIQRMMRCATLYKDLKVGGYISPCDCISLELFKKFVTNNQGQATITLQEMVEEWHKEKMDKEKKARPVVLVDNTYRGRIADTDENVASADSRPKIGLLLNDYPELKGFLSEPRLAGLANRYAQAEVLPEVPAEPAVRNIAADRERMWSRADDVIGQIANLVGPSYGENKEEWVNNKRSEWLSAKRSAGISTKIKCGKSGDLLDIAQVEKLLNVVENRYKEVIKNAQPSFPSFRPDQGVLRPTGS